MLTKCPECELQVSDKALICPHCGYPLKSKNIINITKRSAHKRLPNGFGQITKLNNPNLRKPYRAMVTIGKTADGKFIRKMLKPEAYFLTYNDAYAALVEYNRNPYDLDGAISVEKLYDKWSEEYFKTLKSASSIRTIESAWSYCSTVYKMRVKDVRARHIKGCIENGTANINGQVRSPSAETKTRIKSLFNLMLDYAVEYELTDRNYARTFSISDDVIKEIEENKRGHISFSDDEMNKLWQNINTPWVDVVLIQCYSGWRPQELGLLRLENVNLDKNLITGGMKTEAGTNRIVPIHPRIKGLIEQKYKEAVELGSEYLINSTDGQTHRNDLKLTYEKYQKRFAKVISALELRKDHRPHDPRKQFVTMAKKYNVDEYAIKKIVGHAIDDITEKVYTDRNINWLYEEICKIE